MSVATAANHKCTCPVYEGVKMHYDCCPHSLGLTDQELTYWWALYGSPEDFVDGDDLDTYNERLTFFVHGLRLGRTMKANHD